jgi:hypothetical protein
MSARPQQQSQTATLAPAQAEDLAQACRALWLATVSLMTAFMQTQAPAHRLLLARRISRNLDTLRGQDCFTPGTRATFGRLAERWADTARQLDPQATPASLGTVLLAAIRRFARGES